MPLFHSLPEGTRLELKIYSGEDQSAISTEGKVMWLEFDQNTSAPYVCGIRIERISSSGRRRLVQLLLTALCQQTA